MGNVLGSGSISADMENNEKPDFITEPIIRLSKYGFDEKGIKHNYTNNILILGTRQSGKTTLWNQFGILMGGRWSPEEIENFKKKIFGNMVLAMTYIVEHIEKEEGVENFKKNGQLEGIRKIQKIKNRGKLYEDELFDDEMVDFLRDLWDDKTVQKYSESVFLEKGVGEGVQRLFFYFKTSARIKISGYTPSSDDILCTSSRTLFPIDKKGKIGNFAARIFEIPPLKNWRREIEKFKLDGTQAVFYCVSLTDYHKKSTKDAKKNKLLESLEHFEIIVNSEMFVNVNIILIFTKVDLFLTKIVKYPLVNFFPTYKPPKQKTDMLTSSKWIKHLFLQKVPTYNEFYVYAFFTSLLDFKMTRGLLLHLFGQKKMSDEEMDYRYI